MLRMTVVYLTEGQVQSRFGDEHELTNWLHREFPESEQYNRLHDAVQAVNEFGYATVEVAQYRPSQENNMLPPDFLTHMETHEDDPKGMQ